MSVIFHPLRVRAVQPDTQEAVIVSFDVPEDLRSVFGFTQGQYLTLRKEIDGQDLRRSYSICAGVDDPCLRVGVGAREEQAGEDRECENEAHRASLFGRRARKGGAAWGTRTHDPIITNDVLYQLS